MSEIQALEAILVKLRGLLELFADALQGALRLQELDAKGRRDTDRFTNLAKDVENALLRFSAPLADYGKALRGSTVEAYQDREKDFDSRLRRTIGEVPAGRGNQLFANLLSEELAWINEMTQQLTHAATETMQSVALVLIARAFTNGQEPHQVHLEHYDALEPGHVVSLDKINWAADSAEMRRLVEATRPIVSTLQDIETKRIDVRTGLERILDAHGIDVKPLLRSIGDLAEALDDLRATDWPEELQRIVDRIEQALLERTLDASQRRLLREAMELAMTTRENAIGTLESFARLETGVSALSLTDVIEKAESAADPVDALITLIDGIDRSARLVQEWSAALSGLSARLQEVLTQLRKASESVISLVGAFENLSGVAGSVLQGELERLQRDQFARIAGNVTAVAKDIDALLSALGRLQFDESGQLELYANTDFPIPSNVNYVLGQNIKDTYLDLRTIPGRRDNTPVVLEALLFRTQPETADGASVPQAKISAQIDRERQSFRLHRFGIYSVPNVGVAYVSSMDVLPGQTEKTSQFTVQASWLFRYRSWVKDTSYRRPALLHPSWWDDVGIGVHALALDLNTDSQQEIGVGLTLSLLKDVLQLGYGVNLTLDEEQYFFVGLKLLQFGQTLNVSK